MTVRQYRNARSTAGGPRMGLERSSRNRIARIRWRENTPLGIWILLALLMMVLFVGFPWFIHETGTR
jgi:hypothetical protein